MRSSSIQGVRHRENKDRIRNTVDKGVTREPRVEQRRVPGMRIPPACAQPAVFPCSACSSRSPCFLQPPRQMAGASACHPHTTASCASQARDRRTCFQSVSGFAERPGTGLFDAHASVQVYTRPRATDKWAYDPVILHAAGYVQQDPLPIRVCRGSLICCPSWRCPRKTYLCCIFRFFNLSTELSFAIPRADLASALPCLALPRLSCFLNYPPRSFPDKRHLSLPSLFKPT
jgi:hypothetical protein